MKDVVSLAMDSVKTNVVKAVVLVVPEAVMVSAKVDAGKHVPDSPLRSMIRAKSHVQVNAQDVVVLQPVEPLQVVPVVPEAVIVHVLVIVLANR